MWVIRYFLVTLVLLLVVGFAIQNSYQRVSVNLLHNIYEDVPLVLVLFEAFVLGIFFWFVLSVAHMLKQHNELSRQKRENRKLLEEIKAIRNMPLQEADEEDKEIGLGSD
ncbi:MAG: hypothetical protein CO189_07495 [candidate division Zixibacteria bacterium CG_4_9_14_3_um_filter_46_8]|nr:MAG: hypothetical protein CO189_07495 [candidate division Zixibacteria bacterium CG_4_9_14_3_um_filter_46_8]